jgi:hypothetical protein
MEELAADSREDPALHMVAAATRGRQWRQVIGDVRLRQTAYRLQIIGEPLLFCLLELCRGLAGSDQLARLEMSVACFG